MNYLKMISKKFQRTGKSKLIVFCIFFAVFLVFSFLCLYPLFWCFINSLKSDLEFSVGPSALPEELDILRYIEIFNTFKIGYVGYLEMVFNSVWQAFGWQAINIAASVFVAYPLARYNFPGKMFFYNIIIFRITIPVVGSGAVAYRFIRMLGFINNPLGFSLTYFTGFDLAALVLYGYFKNVSKEYSEAAYLDGATRIKVLFSIVLPLALPCILALFISNVMTFWNNYSTPMIYMTEYPNLAYGIYLMDTNAATLIDVKDKKALFFGCVILSSIVPLLLFGTSQKLMLENMSVGGLKG